MSSFSVSGASSARCGHHPNKPGISPEQFNSIAAHVMLCTGQGLAEARVRGHVGCAGLPGTSNLSFFVAYRQWIWGPIAGAV